MILFSLYYEFFKIGLFSIGGGLTTLPFLYDLAQTHPLWITTKEIADMVAISQSTPGPIGINMATYAGYLAAGPLGGLMATLGEISPSIIIIIIIARFLSKFDQNQYVKDAFYGLRAAVIGLIVYGGSKVAMITLFHESQLQYKEAAMFIVLFVFAEKFKKVHPLFWILIAAVAGIVFQLS
ncbi:chromate transporter [uncultured Sphaerochaeta sp.]|uniref:chromate transporter n=1 Tax=uncultured Sphaerochaeta sp. TaxID=886478 RepID=UPI002A0A6664|nr:chromate transporter [uncultured Sphaerochaeta sp.]